MMCITGLMPPLDSDVDPQHAMHCPTLSMLVVHIVQCAHLAIAQ
jgi:hypothetical protein